MSPVFKWEASPSDWKVKMIKAMKTLLKKNGKTTMNITKYIAKYQREFFSGPVSGLPEFIELNSVLGISLLKITSLLRQAFGPFKMEEDST